MPETIKITHDDIRKYKDSMFPLCRKLLREGTDPETILELWTKEGTYCMGCTIVKGAALVTIENAKEGPYITTYKPFKGIKRAIPTPTSTSHSDYSICPATSLA